MTHIHKRTQGKYEVIAHATLQTDTPLSDMDDVVVYQGEDGRTWVRPLSEFQSRFEEAAPVADQPAEPSLDRVGLFSVGADGDLCFHEGHKDPAGLCRALDEGVTGGPYRARVAYAGPILAPKGDSNG